MVQLTEQQQQIILALQKEVDHRTRQANEAQEKLQLLLLGAGVQRINLVLVPVEPPLAKPSPVPEMTPAQYDAQPVKA